MKVAIASDDKKAISHHFGRSAGFVVFDIKDRKQVGKEYRENIGKSNGQCGSCNHSAMIQNIKDCDFVISFGMGQRIYNDLIDGGVIPFVTDEVNVDEALDKFLKSELKDRRDKLH